MMNNNYTTHIASVQDGAIVCFPHSAYYFMKVCDRSGTGGVVRLSRGLYIATNDLAYYGLDTNVQVVADSLDDFLMGDENE